MFRPPGYGGIAPRVWMQADTKFYRGGSLVLTLDQITATFGVDVSTARVIAAILDQAEGAPAAPAADVGRLFARDVGGKTQFAARFLAGNIKAIVEDPQTLRTLDATTGTAISYTTPTDKVCIILALLTARKSDGTAGATFGRIAGYRNVAGAASLIGAVTSLHFTNDAGLAGVVATLDASGATARVRVTGLAATTIDWTPELWVVEQV